MLKKRNIWIELTREGSKAETKRFQRMHAREWLGEHLHHVGVGERKGKTLSTCKGKEGEKNYATSIKGGGKVDVSWGRQKEDPRSLTGCSGKG